jgi:GT2 family glycosyltransferase
MLTIIIPTRNRENELTNLLQALVKIKTVIDEIIIVDSSDNIFQNLYQFSKLKINYVQTDIKSAAIQRNIGMSLVKENCKLLAFLDDDVIPNKEYFNDLIYTLIKNSATGVSGLAINSKKNKNFSSKKLATIFRLIFLLDSKKQGIVLKSGVNVPVKFEGNTNKITKSQWLIGCALWDFQKIKEVRFDTRLFGQSLGEDVIFSLKASKSGSLLVNAEVYLEHTESMKERPNHFNFYRMWVRNRYYIVKEISTKKYQPAFHWCNFGKSILLFIFILKDPIKSVKSLAGMFYGYFDLVRSDNAN